MFGIPIEVEENYEYEVRVPEQLREQCQSVKVTGKTNRSQQRTETSVLCLKLQGSTFPQVR